MNGYSIGSIYLGFIGRKGLERTIRGSIIWPGEAEAETILPYLNAIWPIARWEVWEVHRRSDGLVYDGHHITADYVPTYIGGEYDE